MSQSVAGYEAKRQWPLWALVGVSLLWLLATLAQTAQLPIGQSAEVAALAGRATSFFPPLVILVLVLAFLSAGRRPMEIDEIELRVDSATRATGELEAQLRRIDETLAACVAKADQLRIAASAEGDGLSASAAVLEVAAGTMALSAADMGKAAAALSEVIPTVSTQAREAEAALRIAGSEARRHIETVETALSQVASHGRDAGREAEAMVTTIQGLIAQIDQSSTETTKTIANRAYTLDAAVTGVLDRSAEAFASIGETLAAQSRSVEQMVASARTELDGFGTEGTRAIGQRLDVLLGATNQLRGQFSEQMQLSDQLRTHAAQSIADVESRLEQLKSLQASASQSLLEQAETGARGFEQRITDLGNRQAESTRHLQSMLDMAIAQVESRLEGLKSRQAELGAEMEVEARKVVSGIELHLADLRVRQQELATSLAAEASASLDQVEGRFVDLGARAAHSHAETVEMLGRTMTAVGTLGDALEGRKLAIGELEERIEGLLPAFEGFAGASEARLPRLADGFESLSDRGRMVNEQLDALADRIESQVALLRDSSAAFERDHAAVVSLSKSLAGEFDTARGIVTEIHSTTEQTAIAAAARMVENVMQVRASVNATAAEIQTLLSSVVAEAQSSLDDFATNKAEAAFGAPIRLQIAALEEASVKAADAAGDASERLATRLVELMHVISETEARVDEVDTRMDVRARDTLAARSIRLVDSLNEVSVDVARLLAVDVGDSAWKRYLEGDKGLFARATVRLADRETARKIARHYTHDADFESEATRYVEQFEQLIHRVLKDPEGESFALILLSSDIGKLYVMIAEAIGRPVARKAA
jgi:hypothetical protein